MRQQHCRSNACVGIGVVAVYQQKGMMLQHRRGNATMPGVGGRNSCIYKGDWINDILDGVGVSVLGKVTMRVTGRERIEREML